MNRGQVRATAGAPPCSDVAHVGWEVKRRRGRYVRHQCRGCLAWGDWERNIEVTIINDRQEVSTVVIEHPDDLDLVKRIYSKPAPPVMFSDDSNLLAEPKPELVRAGARALGLTGLRTMTVKDLRDLARRAEIALPRLARKETIVAAIFDSVRDL